MTAEAPYCIYSHAVREKARAHVCGRTIASVMPLQIPLPPPVQKRTLPLNMSGLNVAARSTAGADVRWTDILGEPCKERCVDGKVSSRGALESTSRFRSVDSARTGNYRAGHQFTAGRAACPLPPTARSAPAARRCLSRCGSESMDSCTSQFQRERCPRSAVENYQVFTSKSSLPLRIHPAPGHPVAIYGHGSLSRSWKGLVCCCRCLYAVVAHHSIHTSQVITSCARLRCSLQQRPQASVSVSSLWFAARRVP
jgi:hypothetical protein